MFTIEDLPFSLVENIYITPLQCWLLFAILLLFTAVTNKKVCWIKVVFFMGVIFSCVHWYHFAKEITSVRLSFTNIAGHTAVELLTMGRFIFWVIRR